MSIVEKGITPFAAYNDTVPIDLVKWLGQLQLRFPKVSTYSVTINPGSIAANDELDETYTVTGLSTNDIVTINPPAMNVGLGIMYARVSATDTLQIRWRNFTGSPINPASGTYRILAIRL